MGYNGLPKPVRIPRPKRDIDSPDQFQRRLLLALVITTVLIFTGVIAAARMVEHDKAQSSIPDVPYTENSE